MAWDAATLRQLQAMDPSRSTWLSANAGSGKTRVLTNRVAKLLLGGTRPQNILCLTYTKAAAALMQNRLFTQLGKWAMLDDAKLVAALAELSIDAQPEIPDLDRARTLFAQAIEAPGGLRIQTIHSFCSALLRRFPLEAQISPLFKEMDERGASELMSEALAALADSDEAALLRAFAPGVPDGKLDRVLGKMVSNRAAFGAVFDRDEILRDLGVSPDLPDQDLIGALFDPATISAIRDAIGPLSQSSKRDSDAGSALASLNLDAPSTDDFWALQKIVLNQSGDNLGLPKLTALPVKTIRDADPPFLAPFQAMMQRVADTLVALNTQEQACRTLDLHAFAIAFLRRYEALKSARALLDFDDLISKTQHLLTDRAVCDWVMYRLDGGIDHILVDESQDTSPRQWDVIKQLTREFGQEGEDGRERTIFVVGDKKQSIFSFQGADPRKFDEMGAHFEQELARLGRRLQHMSLAHSFRSAPAILHLVDGVFEAQPGAGFDEARHIAFATDMPGRVDLWDTQRKDESQPDKDWWDATDLLSPQNEQIALARRIADEIGEMVRHDQIPDGKGHPRPVRFGDFLILVQRRNVLFNEIIRACKARGYPISGADRLKLFEEVAVRDLRALLSFLAVPQDSLALAEVLRSPLCGLDEAALFDLAHYRTFDDLWPELVRRQAEFSQAHAMLKDLRDRADFLPPYELIERALTFWGGRTRLLARLGPEAADGIDAFLSLTQKYEATAPASLTGFLAWIEGDDTEIKRQTESDGDKIRVMTTHGAKGLEAPIVIMPETQKRNEPSASVLEIDARGRAYAPNIKQRATPHQQQAQSAATAAEQAERLRLLYVAMTRAERWLIICGAGDRTDKDGAWHKFVQDAMERVGAARLGDKLRLETGAWPQRSDNPAPGGPDGPADVPQWVRQKPPAEPRRLQIIRPSDVEGAKSLPGEPQLADPEQVARFGTLVHHLLDRLPRLARADHTDLARALSARAGFDPEGPEAGLALAQAQAVLGAPDMAHVFDPAALSEVALSADMPGPAGRRIKGQADRVLVLDGRVLVVDFKSNAAVPATPAEVPKGIIEQMALYVMALAQIYPDRTIEAAIVWTSAPKYMPLPHKMVRDARVRLTSP